VSGWSREICQGHPSQKEWSVRLIQHVIESYRRPERVEAKLLEAHTMSKTFQPRNPCAARMVVVKLLLVASQTEWW
jgi:hypothetical protein